MSFVPYSYRFVRYTERLFRLLRKPILVREFFMLSAKFSTIPAKVRYRKIPIILKDGAS